MKYVLALLFLAALVFAEPEAEAKADPAAEAWYGYYGYPGYYRGYYGYGGYYGHRYGYGYWGRKKREAEADPAVLATTHSAPLVAPVVAPYAYGVPYLHHAVPTAYTVAHKATEVIPGEVTAKVHAAPVVYAAHHPYAWGYGYGLHHPLLVAAKPAEEAVAEARKKREAEAEADPEALYYGYYGGYYGYPRYGYYGGYYGYPGYGYAYWG